MSIEEFAAARDPLLTTVADRLRPGVDAALASDDWYDLLQELGVVFEEVYEAEGGIGDPSFAQGITFLDALERTQVSGQEAQAQRIATWLATAVVGAATDAAAQRQSGKGVQWVTMEDERVRPIHAEAHGQTRRSGQAFDIGGYQLQYPGQPVGPPEAWINCVVGSTKVAWPGQHVVALTRYVADGDFIDVRTVDGHLLTLTPNHPVLTPTGYVPAGDLRPGDQVMAAPLSEAPEVADGPPSIEQAYEAARMTGHVQRVGRGGVDFHGDVPDDEVEVVWPDGDLAAQLRVQRGDPVLVGAGVGQGALGVRRPDQLAAHEGVPARRGSPSAAGRVGGGGQVTALGGAEPGHPQPVGLAAAADGQPEAGQAALDDSSVDAEVARHLEHALAVGVAACEVVEVKRYRARHPVYNLHTSENYYISNGIVTHNCRCVLRVVDIADAMVAAADDTPTDAVLVATPAADDGVWKVSGDNDPHVTLAYFGPAQGLDADPIGRVLAAVAAALDPFTENVMGRGVLGADQADVALIEAKNLAPLREALVADQAIADPMARVEQFPVWIPHLTLGYPAKPAQGEAPETITFDALELWVGPDRHRYTLGSQENFPREAGMSVTQDVVEPQVDEAPPIPEEDLALPVPWYGVLAPEGVWSGDRRRFAEGALRNRDLPLPLKYQSTSDEGHRGSVVVGRIDRVWREGAEMRAEGVFDSNPHAYEAVRQIAERMIRGVSVDVDDAEGEMSDGSDGVPEGSLTFSSARISAATLVAIPAFSEAFVALGYWGEGQDAPQEGDFAVSEEAWDGSASRFTPEQWKRSCILHVCDGDEKSCHKLPVREPGGALSRRGVHAAAARINQVDAPSDKVAAAKRALAAAYRQLGEEAPFAGETFEAKAPGLHKDGTPPKCKYGDEPATKYVLHAEGMAYVPACDKHLDRAKHDAERATPDGSPDPGNINRIGSYTATEFDIPPAKTKDGPGWITHPRPTREITAYWVDGRGRAKIGWGAPGDFNRCRSQLAKYVQNPDWLAGLCANLHYRALGIWPGQHRGEAALTAAGGPPPKEWFTDPHLAGPTAMQITEQGRVYGHLALWKTCHTARGGCVRPPRSATNYAYFHTGEILTDSGPVPVGQVTLGGGHASLSLGVRGAREHYDNTGSAVADVVVGEDTHGIWFSGALRPSLTTKDLADLRAAALSGDWRDVDGGYEMIAALAVNVPGFPVPRISVATAGAHGYALTAAGVVTEDAVAEYLLEMAAKARTTLKVTKARRVLEGSRHG